MRRKRASGHIRWNVSAGPARRGSGAVEPAEKGPGSWVGRPHHTSGGRPVAGEWRATNEGTRTGVAGKKADPGGNDALCLAAPGELTNSRDPLPTKLGVGRQSPLSKQL